MIIRRTTEPDGTRRYLVSAWVMNSALTIVLAWVTSITFISWDNSVILGEGPRFTAYDAAILQQSIQQLSNEILDVASLYEICNQKIEMDRDRRAEIHAEFQLFRRELMNHAREDDRRFGQWLHTFPGDTPAGGLIGPWINQEDFPKK